MIKLNNGENSNFYFSSGDWYTHINAESKESALNALVEELRDRPEVDIGKVVVCVDLKLAVNDLTLEDALFFIPLEKIAEKF